MEFLWADGNLKSQGCEVMAHFRIITVKKKTRVFSTQVIAPKMVLERRLELPPLAGLAPQASASAIPPPEQKTDLLIKLKSIGQHFITLYHDL